MGGGGTDIDFPSLSAWFSQTLAISEPLSVTKFAGGQSNPTYRVTAGNSEFVLRRKPFGQLLPSAHAVDREYRLISALHPTGFPVAKPYGLCSDDTVIGSMFYVMAFVEGRSLADGKLPRQKPPERRDIYEAIIETLATLHNIDHHSVGLSDYGPPGNYFDRQVRRWTKQYRAAQTDDIAEVEKLIDYLGCSVPEQTRTSIIHGDYRIDNLMFANDTPEVAAVLDWELSTIGDPIADFAYLAMQWHMASEGQGAGLKGVDFAASGIPTLDEMVTLYCTLTNRDGVPALDWYFAYNLFRLLGIVQGIKKRFLDGNASNANAEQAGSAVPRLAAAAWEFARKAGAKT
jgi:aminoglycoside phosphotransferase (APT) family kinase protein